MKIEDSLGYLLNVSAKRTKHSLEKYLKSYGITSSQFAVIKLLSEKETLNQADIAKSLNSDPATCSTIIEKLVKKELVLKQPAAADRRVFMISLSVKAEKIVGEMAKKAGQINKTALKGFSRDEEVELKRLLSKIITNTEHERNEL